MKIVVLDGFAMNPGDLSWDTLGEIGDLTVHERTSADLTIARAKDAEIVLTNKTLLMKDVIEKLPKLKYIGVLATGYNVVDIPACKSAGITVCNVPAYSTDSVGQMVFSFITAHCQHVAEHTQSVKAGDWVNCKDFSYWNYPLIELTGQTLGIIGYGLIGKKVASIASAFGMNIMIATRSKPDSIPDNARLVEVEDIFRESDFISLHCPLTDDTTNMVNASRLAMMKKTAFIINTGRGPLVDQAALADALNAGSIAGAAADVLNSEPPAADNPLLKAKNIYITPHIAWATFASRTRLINVAIDNVKAFAGGAARNIVS